MRQSIFIAATLAFGLFASAAQAETIQVQVNKLVYNPIDVQAKVGDTIEWVNNDPFAHTATVKGGWEVMLPPKKSGTYVVTEAGTIDYYCRFHPNMKGMPKDMEVRALFLAARSLDSLYIRAEGGLIIVPKSGYRKFTKAAQEIGFIIPE